MVIPAVHKFPLPPKMKKIHSHTLLVLTPLGSCHFGVCNAPTTFQGGMISIFFNLFKKCLEIFMDAFSINGDFIDDCLINLDKALKRC